MKAELLSIVSVVGVSLVSLVGLLTVSVSKARVRRFASVSMSFAAGALMGDAFIHLIPETFSKQQAPLSLSLWILAGIMIFFMVEKLMRHRHVLNHRDDDHLLSQPGLAAVNVLGDAIHNFIDGLLIGAAYLSSSELGIATTAAVLFHEIPQEFSDFSILVHSGFTVRTAVLINLASASVAILGTVTALLAGTVVGEVVADRLIPVTAGGFVYLAAADIIPELQQDRSFGGLITQTALMSLGIGLMALLTILD